MEDFLVKLLLYAGIGLVFGIILVVDGNRRERKSFTQAPNYDEPKAESCCDISEHLDYLEEHFGIPCAEL